MIKAANESLQRRDSANGKAYDEEMGPYLTQTKTSGGLTISPELFEKVKQRFRKQSKSGD